jgi:hypothetical protein
MNIAWSYRTGLVVLVLAALGALPAGCANSTDGDPAVCPTACGTFSACCANATASGEAACVAITSNNMHCGACGRACAAGTVCVSSMCQPIGGGDGGGPRPDGGPVGECTAACSDTQRCCGTNCVSRSVAPGADGRGDTSFSHCNGCGIACDATRASACSVMSGSTSPECMCGTSDQCGAGRTCVASGGSFACVNLSTDPMNCGDVGRACATGESCVDGECGCGSTTCGSGEACCAGACVDTTSSAANCGACGTTCDAGESCQASACVCGSGPTARACTAPMPGDIFGGGDAMLGESCCGGTCVANTDTSCGCGVTCNAADDETCQVGGGGLPLPGGGGGGDTAQVCCGDDSVAFLGCGGGFGFGDGGGFPGFDLDGGLPIPGL